MGNCFSKRTKQLDHIKTKSNSNLNSNSSLIIHNKKEPLLKFYSFSTTTIDILKKNHYIQIELYDEYLMLYNIDTSKKKQVFYYSILRWFNTQNNLFGFEMDDNKQYIFNVQSINSKLITNTLSKLTHELKDYIDTL
tara:strand:- start:162 stop:572 length:411 start_codon:yes stop_codon:yes gene_type:complete